nr:hypothetical protein [Bacteroidota bacterium]
RDEVNVAFGFVPFLECGDTLVDTRDMQKYATVQIGDQCWMAENLNVGERIDGVEEMTNNGTIEKYCYNNNIANCDEYGGLYQWNEMMQYATTKGTQGICPLTCGWHIPTDEDWKILEGTVDSQYPVGDPIWNNTGWRGYDAGKNLKSTTGWYQNTGTDAFGFTALSGGARSPDGNFGNLTNYAYFWSSSEFNSSFAWFRDLNYGYTSVGRGDAESYGFSARCVQDYLTPNLPPELPSSPNPEDGAINQSIGMELSWICTDPDGDPLTYDIYFGTETTTPPQVITGIADTFYATGTLEYSTIYYWKIVAHDDHGNITEGDTWSFSTSDSAWTIVETYQIPGKASGLAWDGQYIYFGQYSAEGNQIYRFIPSTGTYEFVCSGPMEDAYGLTWDGQYLWSTDHPGSYDPGIAYQFDLSGNVNYQFECPATYIGGIAYDNGLFWLATYYNPDGWIYKVDLQGSIFDDFAAPAAQPWDICLQDEYLWIADYNSNMLFKVDTITGTLIESHSSENTKPSGIVWDGQYIWYVDGPLSTSSTLYKVVQ